MTNEVHEQETRVTDVDQRDIASKRKKKRWTWILGGAVLAGIVGWFAIPWVYINFIKEPAPKRLTFENVDAERANESQAPSDANSVALVTAQVWTVVAPSQAGYRVEEVIAGQKTTAVGRTTTVDGSVTLDLTQISAAEVNVDLASVKSDEPRRDSQFQTRIMDVENFPVASFVLSKPIDLPGAPSATAQKVSAAGTLSLRGVDKEVVADIEFRLRDGKAEITGSIPIVFADFEIPNPSIGPVETEDRGLLEFSLSLKAA
jgi:polyisoprenoid-binding protein YceI